MCLCCINVHENWCVPHGRVYLERAIPRAGKQKQVAGVEAGGRDLDWHVRAVQQPRVRLPHHRVALAYTQRTQL
jgi:hypothetical protein